MSHIEENTDNKAAPNEPERHNDNNNGINGGENVVNGQRQRDRQPEVSTEVSKEAVGGGDADRDKKHELAKSAAAQKSTTSAENGVNRWKETVKRWSGDWLGRWARNWGRGENLTGLLIALLLGVVLLIMVRFPIKFDLTSTHINTLSKASKTLVSDLRDPMRIKVFVSPNLPPPFNTLEQSLRDVLNEYRQAAGTNFYYTFYKINEKQADADPTIQENIDLAKSYNIYPQSIQTIEKDEVKLVNVYSGLVIEYGNVIERIDFIADSEALEYRFSSIFKKVTDKVNTLLSMQENIRMTLYLGDDFVELSPLFGIGGLGKLVGEIKDMIEELGRENYSKLDFEYNAETVADDQQAYLAELGVQTYPWNDFSANGRNYEAGIGTAFILVEHEGRSEVLELISREELIQITDRGLERGTRYQIVPSEVIKDRLDGLVNNILEITPPLSYLKGNGSVDFVQGDYQVSPQQTQDIASAANFSAVLGSRYKLVGVDLADLTPQLYPVFMLAGVKEPLTEYELFLIDQYLMKGGSLVVFHDSFKEEQAAGGGGVPTWVKNETGIERLIEHYGVRIDPSIVMDKVSFVSRTQNQNSSASTEQQVYYVPLIENQNINAKLPYLNNVKGIFFIAGSPLFPDEEVLTANDITTERLFSSSVQSWNVSDDVTLVPYLIQPPNEEEDNYTSFDLAYVLKGSFPSYFKGKDIPEREFSEKVSESEDDHGHSHGDGHDHSGEEFGLEAEEDHAEDEVVPAPKAVQQFSEQAEPTTIVEQAPESSQIFVIGSSEIIKNNVVDNAGRLPNAVMLLNTIDALNGDIDWARMRSKGQRVNPLDIRVSGEGGLVVWWKRPTFIKAINLVGLPAVVVLFGLWMYLRKARIKRRVAEHFSALARKKQ
ncbi:hypothetical protein COTS27_01405 [Spirochaetota bacterium]|nr:hypothetical protein COTS27_01405 [Spirochaetota bacterium]